MKTRLTALVALLLLSSTVLADGIKQIEQLQNAPSFLGYVPDRFIVVMKPEAGELQTRTLAPNIVHVGNAAFDQISDRFAVSDIKKQFAGSKPGPGSRTAELARYHKVTINAGSLDAAMAAYRTHPLVERVEPIGIHAMYATPSDFYYSYQWHLNQGSDHDIDAPEAWDIETGSDATIVAILDSGTRYYHPDLGGVNASPSNPGASRGNMWINNAELNGSAGVDDDGNGYTDDWIGYDFISSTTSCWPGEDCNTQDNDPRDFNGHGTHTAGIFGMITNDGYGMCGVAGGWGNGTQTQYGNGVKIMALRMGYSYNYLGQEYGVVLMDAAAEAFYYAADNGAKIASCSWGSSNSGGIGAAATYFINAGGIIVVAAGNDGAEVSPPYLNSRGDCISVAATDENDNGASFTTYGTWVNICAPGNNIYSTYHDHTDPNTNYWAAMGGTSMATPMVAGTAALIWSQNPSWTAAQVTTQLYGSTDNIDAYLSSKYIGKMGVGRINAHNAVNVGTPPPVAAFTGAPTSGCAPLTVNFADQSTGDITTWDWTFGDGGTSTAQNPSYEYANAGTYTVSLTLTGPGGSDTDTKAGYITVNGAPSADFVGSPTSGTEPLTVDFTDLSTGAASWSWNFGDLGTSTQQNPSHTYANAGTYTVTLTATNACGSDQMVKVDYIAVDPCMVPTANFAGAPTSGEAPLTVDFTDQSTGNPAGWDWNFGDGGTSTQQNPSYTFNNAGTYTVTMTATNACGSDQIVRVDYITVTPCVAPTAAFVGMPTTGDAPLTVDFTDQSTGNPTGWDWDFGDGGSSVQQNPTYTYTAAGTYTVTLTATNSCGGDVATEIDYITVTEAPVQKAYAVSDIPVYGTRTGDFTSTFASDNVREGLTEVLSTGHPVKITSWLDHKWDLYIPSSTSATFYLEAYRPANGDGENFTFAYSLDDATYIDLITVASATEQVYSAALPDGLSGTVYVRVRDSNRSWGSTSLDAVYVDEMYIEYSSQPAPPVANFVGNPTSGTIPLTVSFTDLSSGSPTGWNWTFGDGGTSTAQNPAYEYTAAGVYTVSLTVSNAYGSDIETKIDYITVTEAGNTMHVHAMTVGRAKVGPDYVGTCTVTIHDNLDQPVGGATVYVAATGPTSGSYSGATATDGTVSFQTAGVKKPSGEWCFEVTNVTRASYVYDAGANDATSACESGPVYAISPAAADHNTGQNLTSRVYPNPFNASANITFGLNTPGNVAIEVYDVLGRPVRTVASAYFPAGTHTVPFNGTDNAGRVLSTGMYFYRITTPDYVESKKMILLK